MKRLLSIMLILVLSFGLLIPSAVYGNEQGTQEYLVQFKGSSGVSARGMATSYGIQAKQVKQTLDILPVQVLELTPSQAKALASNPNVVAVEPNAEVTAYAQTVPWGITRVQAPQAHAAGYRGAGVKVAVLDTGIDSSHPDLNVRGGYSVFTDSANSNPFYDGDGHGTHVAGTIAALNNTIGVLGVAYNVDLYAVKVLNNNGGGTYAGIAQGIQWAVNNGMHIVNMSLGGPSSSTILQNICDAANQAGVLLIAAAGNSGNASGTGNSVGYPARYASVMAVASTNSNNVRGSSSSTGPAVEISAPGVSILSTVPGNGYATYTGTSMASPHVAGVAALVKGARPNLSNTQIRQILNSTATPLGNSNHYGNGLVQAVPAINAALAY
ncbi:S8 family peptidase [Alkaliphilus crotonatoxidans]